MGCAIIYEKKDNLYFIISVKNVDKEKEFHPSVIHKFSFCTVFLLFLSQQSQSETQICLFCGKLLKNNLTQHIKVMMAAIFYWTRNVYTVRVYISYCLTSYSYYKIHSVITSNFKERLTTNLILHSQKGQDMYLNTAPPCVLLLCRNKYQKKNKYIFKMKIKQY